jgi:hypothetical protein
VGHSSFPPSPPLSLSPSLSLFSPPSARQPPPPFTPQQHPPPPKTTRQHPNTPTHPRFPVDSFRYYLAKDPFGGDINFSPESLLAAHNNELADVLVRFLFLFCVCVLGWVGLGGLCVCVCVCVCVSSRPNDPPPPQTTTTTNNNNPPHQNPRRATSCTGP